MKPYYQDDSNAIYCADALEVMKGLPDNSIDLIATDPPYFKVKDSDWDHQWDKPEIFLAWIGQLCDEWQRILKPNGSLYCFASPQMSARVEISISQRFNVLNNIRWVKDAGWHRKADKEAIRSFLSPWESVIFAEQVCGGGLNPLAEHLLKTRKAASFTCDQVERLLGYTDNKGRGSRLFYRWETGSSLPSCDDYGRSLKILGDNRSSEDLRQEYEDLRQEYEDLRRPFHARSGAQCVDVWDFTTVSVSVAKHECEKPIAMMRHIVEISSRPGAVVLDCFAGSGTTLLAAKELGRKSIGVEREEKHCKTAAGRLRQGLLFEAA